MQRAATLFALGCIAALLAASAASADRPTFNPVCDGTKIESPVTGTYTMSYGDYVGQIFIQVYDTPAGQEFAFQTDGDSDLVASVVAKGGTDYRTWTIGATHGQDLYAPLNPHSGYGYDLSYLCFNTVNAGGVG